MRHKRKKAPVPRYYLRYLQEKDPERYVQIHNKRLKHLQQSTKDNSPERLAAKKRCLTAKTKHLKRELQ